MNFASKARYKLWLENELKLQRTGGGYGPRRGSAGSKGAHVDYYAWLEGQLTALRGPSRSRATVGQSATRGPSAPRRPSEPRRLSGSRRPLAPLTANNGAERAVVTKAALAAPKPVPKDQRQKSPSPVAATLAALVEAPIEAPVGRRSPQARRGKSPSRPPLGPSRPAKKVSPFGGPVAGIYGLNPYETLAWRLQGKWYEDLDPIHRKRINEIIQEHQAIAGGRRWR